MYRQCSDFQDEAVLRALGYWKTPQHLLILSVLLQATQRHLTLHQILERVHEHSLGVNSSIVYRSLKILEAANLIHSTLLPSEGMTYQFVRAYGEEYNPVCQYCHRIVPFESELLPALAHQLEERHHYHEVKTGTTATGYCDECWSKLHLSM